MRRSWQEARVHRLDPCRRNHLKCGTVDFFRPSRSGESVMVKLISAPGLNRHAFSASLSSSPLVFGAKPRQTAPLRCRGPPQRPQWWTPGSGCCCAAPRSSAEAMGLAAERTWRWCWHSSSALSKTERTSVGDVAADVSIMRDIVSGIDYSDIN